MGRRKGGPTKLTPKEAIFVAEYLASNGNATEAATKAGYKHPARMASFLMDRPRVRNAVNREMKEVIGEARIRSDDLIQHLHDGIFLDPAELLRPDGTVKDLSEIPENIRRCIKSFRVRTTTHMYDRETVEVEVKTVDKDVLLTLAMKFRGMLIDRSQINHDGLAGQVLIHLPDNGRGDTVEGTVVRREAKE